MRRSGVSAAVPGCWVSRRRTGRSPGRRVVCRASGLRTGRGSPRLRGEPGVAREHPTTMRPGLDGVLVQPAPDGGAADVGDDSSADGLAPDVGAAEAGQWQAGLMWHLASRGLDGDDHVGGNPRGRPGRGSSPRPARRRSKNRLRHLLTICRGVSRRSPITLLDRPSAA